MESGSEDGELPRRRRVSGSHAGDGEPQGEGSVPPERIEDGANEIQIPHRRAEVIADEENERAWPRDPSPRQLEGVGGDRRNQAQDRRQAASVQLHNQQSLQRREDLGGGDGEGYWDEREPASPTPRSPDASLIYRRGYERERTPVQALRNEGQLRQLNERNDAVQMRHEDIRSYASHGNRVSALTAAEATARQRQAERRTEELEEEVRRMRRALANRPARADHMVAGGSRWASEGQQGDRVSPGVDHAPGNQGHASAAPRGSQRFTAPVEMEPFPKDIKASDKLFQWRYWLGNLKLALEHLGIHDQREKAVELRLAAGVKAGQIIMTRQLMMDADNIDPNFRHFDFLVEGIEAVFAKHTDGSINAKEFRTREQKDGKTVLDYSMRTEKVVQMVDLKGPVSSTLVVSAFIDGLRDKMVRDWANSLNWSMETGLDVVTRCENDTKVAFPWENEARGPEVIAALEGSGTTSEGGRSAGPRSDYCTRKPDQQRFVRGKQARTSDENSRGYRQQAKSEPEGEKCAACDRHRHNGGQCPAVGRVCFKCGETGHFEAVCKASGVRNVSAANAKVEDSHMVRCRVGGVGVKFLIDSDADANVIAEVDWETMKRERAETHNLNERPSTKLLGYAAKGGLEIVCSFGAWVEVCGVDKPTTLTEFFVVKGGRTSLLGRRAATAMKLLAVGLRVNAVQMEPAEFPPIPGVLVDFDIDYSVEPVCHSYVSIPANFHAPAIARLKKMEEAKVIGQVHDAPDWLSGLSAVPKGKGDFRLVVNMTAPNRTIQRLHHRLPRLDELKAQKVPEERGEQNEERGALVSSSSAAPQAPPQHLQPGTQPPTPRAQSPPLRIGSPARATDARSGLRQTRNAPEKPMYRVGHE
jgi:hypothetical protein